MKRIFISIWAHLSFAHRIFIAISFSLLFAGGLILIMLTKQDAKDALHDLEMQKEQTLKMLPIFLSESIVIGDYETIQQQLNGYVTSPYVQNIVFYDAKGKSLQSSDADEPKDTPQWFETLFGLCDSYGQTHISIGGIDYGSIAVRLSIQSFSNRIWNDFRVHFGVMFAIILLDFLGLWLTLYRSLEQLSALEQSTIDLGNGYFAPIQLQGGLRETAKVVNAFNLMIEKVKTTQKELQDTSDEMKQRKHWIETIINSLDEGVYAVDLEGIILLVNAKACSILGYTEEEMIGKQAHRLFHSHTLNGAIIPLEECPMYKALVTKSAWKNDTEYFTCKDSRMIPVEIFGNSIVYENQALGMVFAFRDIGERKALEEKMKLLSTALEATTNAVVITNKDAIIEWVSKGF
ncbi:hypothetical protein SJPD1_0471 [Sulfurospirillum diekertiae]|nr:PAS domain S-box protein [Sulfurospirillum diekertiae]ATB68593.1 hypothetical protein SJPD1_0471 [Sulfurospirillum diekertiae]